MWSLKVSLLPVFAQAGESPDLKKSPVETRQRRMTKDHDGMGTGMGLSFPLWMGKILIFRGGSTAPTQKKKNFPFEVACFGAFWVDAFWLVLAALNFKLSRTTSNCRKILASQQSQCIGKREALCLIDLLTRPDLHFRSAADTPALADILIPFSSSY